VSLLGHLEDRLARGETLRILGLVLMAVGLGLVWLGRR